MSFDNFLQQAWSDHARDPQGVADRVAQQAATTSEHDAQVLHVANFAVHVFGEHLGKWDEGIAREPEKAGSLSRVGQRVLSRIREPLI